MAAYIIIKGAEFQWHVNEKLPFEWSDIKNISEVQIAAHEAELIYGIGLVFNHNRVHTLKGNEAKLYSLYIYEKYKDCKPPTIKESSILNILLGKRNPRNN